MPLPDLLEDAAATPADRVDVELLWRRGRRRRARTAAGRAGALAGIVAVAALTVPSLLRQDSEQVDLAVGGPVTQTAAPEPTTPAPAPEKPWEELTLTEALDRLIAVNQAQPAPEIPAGDVRITELVEAHPAYSVPEPDQPRLWEVTLRSQIVASDGTRSDAGGIVAEGLDPSTDFRAAVTDADLDALLATLPSGSYQPAHDVDGDGVPDPVGTALTDARLTEAEAMAAADPGDDLVIEVVAEALRGTVPAPAARARALGVLRGLDPSLLEYRGPVRDLLDREGIAIVATHPDDLGETTMIFSPETGALLGEEYLWAADAESEPELTGLTAVVDERVVNALP